MTLPKVKDLKVFQKKVLLRTNYDVPLTNESQVVNDSRIEESLPTINYFLNQKAKVIILSHLDRPGGKKVTGLSLRPAAERLRVKLNKTRVKLANEILGEKTSRMVNNLKGGEVLVLENLRFDPGEEGNETSFAKKLSKLADFYINDAFAVSHRPHASIVSLPLFLPSAFGLDFLQEIKILSKLKKNPKRPLVVILGGKKKSKLEAAPKLADWADYLLVGGQHVEDETHQLLAAKKKVLGSLTKSGEDITMETVEKFKKVLSQAKTIVWAGPLGAFEEEKFARGTKLIAKSVVESGAFTVVGGGDTEAALTKFGLVKKIDYVSSGGGAMLAFLSEGTLPGIEAIIKKQGEKNG